MVDDEDLMKEGEDDEEDIIDDKHERYCLIHNKLDEPVDHRLY